MQINYKITEISKTVIEQFPWIKSRLSLGEIGTRDSRELIRLLENIHYPHIKKTLKQIDKYGKDSGEIGESILACNDPFVLSRLLAELNLFVHLYDNLGSKVTPVRRVPNQKTPDLSIIIDDYEILIEIFSPMDFYGYQIFTQLLTSCIKNLDIDFGFDISVSLKSYNFVYTCDFPQFRDIYNWLDQFKINFRDWLEKAKPEDIYYIDSPASSAKLKIQLKSIYENPEIRSVYLSEATRSTDTTLFFRIGNPGQFAMTQWGIKIKDKLQKQQAGPPRPKAIRILSINFSLSDTSDLSFLNNPGYFSNFENDIKYLAEDISPYPPYDVVIACELGFECGFSKPVNLSSYNDEFINMILSKIYLNKPIRKIKVATEEQVNEFLASIKKTNGNS